MTVTDATWNHETDLLNIGSGEAGMSAGIVVRKRNPRGLIDSAPFVALRVHPATLGTAIGLRTTANAQGVDEDYGPIDGLYSSGINISSVRRGYDPGGGINMAPAIVLTHAAVRHPAGISQAEAVVRTA